MPLVLKKKWIFLFFPVWLSVAVIKKNQTQLTRGKGFIWLLLPGHGLSLKEVRAGTDTETIEGQHLLWYLWLSPG